MKKTLSLLLSCTLFIFSGVNISFASSLTDSNKELNTQQANIERSITSQSKLPLQKIKINPLNSKEVEGTINNYQLQPETVKDIREFAKKVQNGEITAATMNIYVPAVSQEVTLNSLASTLSTSSNRTYTGYNNKTYYEETVTYSGISSEKEINKTTKSNWINYLNGTITEVAKFFVDKGLNAITLGYWDIAKIFTSGIPGAVSNYTEVTHTAKLIQTVVKKNTYLVMDNQYYFGYKGEYSNTNFQNFVNIPGYAQVNGLITEVKAAYTPSFYEGDKKAWLNYVNGGYVENFNNYSYGNTSFPAM
ncbi:hypothetical protein F4V43_00175 [Paenibacillus spiritus]|uniref:Uncharacterized protein n=1 Tax=Paenibacillus spiritus TaxID=2496557 RepID=A0A5J5GLU3_9BACL|nr:hypothetical protein [Paenibacillus spiritus]KAA9008588.1 hypothetical protein F4V43_00175 [Paenibacillus spiritus]